MAERIHPTETVVPSYSVVLPKKHRRDKKKRDKTVRRNERRKDNKPEIDEEHLVDRRA